LFLESDRSACAVAGAQRESKSVAWWAGQEIALLATIESLEVTICEKVPSESRVLGAG
jgi:hypothetical protein